MAFEHESQGVPIWYGYTSDDKMLCSQAEGKGCREPREAGQEAASGGPAGSIWSGSQRGRQPPGHLPHHPQGIPKAPCSPAAAPAISYTIILRHTWSLSQAVDMPKIVVCPTATAELQMCAALEIWLPLWQMAWVRLLPATACSPPYTSMPCAKSCCSTKDVGLSQLWPALQRACRRHGIQRWPRRQLLKLSRAIDQINATGSLKNSDGTTASGVSFNPSPPSTFSYCPAPGRLLHISTHNNHLHVKPGHPICETLPGRASSSSN